MGRLFFYTLVILTLGGIIWFNQDSLIQVLGLNPAPCSRPILYSIGDFDSNFNMSEAKFIADIANSSNVWNDALGKTLLKYDPKGSLKINLIYDYRQQATTKQAEISSVISSKKASYDAMKQKYESLSAQYSIDKSALQKSIDSYNQSMAAYNQSMQNSSVYRSSSGMEVDQLRSTRSELESRALIIEQNRAKFNALVETLNNAATQLNNLAKSLNIDVTTYNNVGRLSGEVFNEGEYIEDVSGKRINIYEFKNESKLIRVLEHELGHAIGILHVDDPEAIMYYMNEGSSNTLTENDISELKNVCGIR
ncbi:MAG: matrixin family metalloprotease [Candidatus Taylorbacteria bacterium]